ncbi:FAD-dependent oxidoreductase [Aestuariibius sp. HNIBRBA575]|uniref:FAD-binding oxidoreductase n=1 Tax=Aestuariibius sp. HNIBRBA575 TaxID=3233343 RepID=UPI0034A23731
MTWNNITYAGWGRARKAKGDAARPERARALTALSKEGPAMGNCRSYGDASLNSGGKITDMTRLDRILSFDDKTGLLQVEAGMTLGELAEMFAPKGWLPMVMPGTGFCTVGGAIAMDVHGKNHHNEGSFGQHITQITLIQNGVSRDVTPNDDALWRATIGGLGQTGIIASATMQLKSCKGDVMMVTERRAENWDDHLAILDASDATYVVGWIDATARGAALGRGIVEEGETGAGLVTKPKKSRTIPMDAPNFALSAPIVKMFNNAYYRRVPAAGRTVVKPIQEFFFPLDKIHDWNRLYGKRGFHQFQCVVPLDQADALKEILEKIAHSGLASPLAVLKRMGPGRAGYMSFPMEGYTLAVDFPARDAAQSLIQQLEDKCLKAGGRIYLAKDALSRGDNIKAMYTEYGQWAAEVAKADPTKTYETDMVRRLQLRNEQ